MLVNTMSEREKTFSNACLNVTIRPRDEITDFTRSAMLNSRPRLREADEFRSIPAANSSKSHSFMNALRLNPTISV